MRTALIVNFKSRLRSGLAAVAIGVLPMACAAALPFRSPEKARASELADALENDPVAFETSRAALAESPEIQSAFCGELCDRILRIEEERRRREATWDPNARERASQMASRFRSTIPTLGEPAARTLIQQISGAGYEVSLASELLGKFEDSTVEGSIRAALESPDAAVRRGGLRAVAASPSRIVQFQEITTGLLKDPSWIVRREAASVLGQSKLSGARWDDALAATLADEEMFVAREAARALGRRLAITKVAAMIEFLEKARAIPDPGAVESAVLALYDITNRRDIPPDPVAWRRWLEQNAPASKPAEKDSPAKN